MKRWMLPLAGVGLLLLGLVIGTANQLSIGPTLGDLADGTRTTSGLLVVVGISLAGIALIAGMAYPRTYVPALWAIAPLIPGLAAVCVVGAYLVATEGGSATKFFIGVEIAAGIAVVGAIPLRILATVRVAQTRSYWELRRRSEQLAERLRVVKERGATPRSDRRRPTWSIAQEMALAEAGEQLAAVHEALFRAPPESLTNGLEWVSAMGYVSLWRRVDRAEEALIEVEPSELVLADALHDQLRLAGAGIKSDQLEVALAAAVEVIDAPAHRRYFAPSEAVASTAPGPLPAIRARLRAGLTGHDEADREQNDAAARAVLREVRHAINAYVEEKMESIVRARNRLWRAILLTATTTFLLVGLAVLSNVEKPQLVAGSVFFLVAAIVGLFNRLRLQAKADSAVEDFNLFEARLVHTPLISGLAGVAGVFLVWMAPAAAGQALGNVSLSGIFDLDHNILGIVVAAGFGLAPDRIIGPLQDQTEHVKSQLKAGQAAVETAPSTAAGASSTPAETTGLPG